MSFGFGDKAIGLQMAELQSALITNINNALSGARKGADGDQLSPLAMMEAIIPAAEQSAELAGAFADKFTATGATEWASLCRGLEKKFKDQVASGRAATSEVDWYHWIENFFNGIGIFGEDGAMDRLVAKGAGASFAKQVCEYAGPIFAGIDIYKAWREGDLNKIAGIAVGAVVGSLIGVIGAAVAPLAGAGALVVLIGVGVMAVAGGNKAAEG